jgi:AraC family transcriptional regulator
MQVRIEKLQEKRLLGLRMRMSLAQNRTADLWRAFMPLRRELKDLAGNDLFSVELYDKNYFGSFNPNNEFEKWAAAEVKTLNDIFPRLEKLIIPEGLYAVFTYKGKASEGAKAYQYIFAEWLPASQYELDQRPHFALMGEKYKNDDPESEEELWVPVKPKNNL